jgi:hypothetical protein
LQLRENFGDGGYQISIELTVCPIVVGGEKMSDPDKPFEMVVRIPADVKEWLRDEAKRNLSSQASEVVRSLRARMQAEQRAAR